MVEKQMIKEVVYEEVEFVSPIFITTKSDGGVNLILNLKSSDEFVKYDHFKMNAVKSILNMITKKCYMATTDFKNPYSSVGISKCFQKCLGILYCFT